MTEHELPPQFEGTQSFMVQENGDVVAHVTQVAYTHLPGVQCSLEVAKSVSRIGLGLAFIHAGFGVLVSLKPEYADEARDLAELIVDTIRQYKLHENDTFEDHPF